MVNTVVDICNMALIRLGASRITSLEDDSKQALLCKEYYQQTSDEVVEDFEWPEAITRADLAQLAETPEYGYDYVYQLPTNPLCLRVLDADDPDVDYRIEGRKLYTDAEDIEIRYLARITDPTKYSSQLAEAIALRLASKLAFSLPNQGTMYQALMAEYVVVLRHARGRAALHSRQDGVDQTDYWEDDR